MLTILLPSSKVHSPNPIKRNDWRYNISEVVRVGSIIIFHQSEPWKAKFSILCGVIFLVKLWEKFEIDNWPLPGLEGAAAPLEQIPLHDDTTATKISPHCMETRLKRSNRELFELCRVRNCPGSHQCGPLSPRAWLPGSTVVGPLQPQIRSQIRLKLLSQSQKCNYPYTLLKHHL